jgi:hypothetical protein
MKNKAIHFLFAILLVASVQTATAQSTEFTYQGRLTDGGMPPTASYDFEFRLFDENNALLDTINRLGVTVTNGAFTVGLDFGALFPGAARSLEIAVKPAGSGSYTTLSPRQPITSAPYSIRSREAATADNAIQLAGLEADNFVQYDANGDVELGGNLSVAGNLSVTGTFSSDVVNTASEYQIGGRAVIRTPATNNLFAGIDVGPNNSATGVRNTYVGNMAARFNANGDENVYVGFNTGRLSSNVDQSVFVGVLAGDATSSGDANTFLGHAAGMDNTTGQANTFVGLSAGNGQAAGQNNTAVGAVTSVGNNSTFATVIGSGAGFVGTSNFNLTVLGANASVTGSNLTFATAIGAGSSVSTSNTIALGRANGSDKVRVFGLGSAGNTTVCRNASNELSTCVPGNIEPGSPNYIQNNAGFPQDASFAILGNGSIMGDALIGGTLQVNGTRMSLGLSRFLSVFGTRNTLVGHNTGPTNTGADNSFVGFNAGNANTTGADNSFFGSDAGGNNIDGANNSFFGSDAGDTNESGHDNSFFGRGAGKENVLGEYNSYFGSGAGRQTGGSDNSFFGYHAGRVSGSKNSLFGVRAGESAIGTRNSFFGYLAGANSGGATSIEGEENSFFGATAGLFNSNGARNSFFGYGAGGANTLGTSNSYLGHLAGSSIALGLGNTFVGRDAGRFARQGNYNVFIGEEAAYSSSDESASTGDSNVFIGKRAGGSTRLIGSENTLVGHHAGSTTAGNRNVFIGNQAGIGTEAGLDITLIGNRTSAAVPEGSPSLSFATAIGSGAVVANSNTVVLGRNDGSDRVLVHGILDLGTLGAPGSLPLCRNTSGHISACLPTVGTAGKTETESLKKEIESLKSQVALLLSVVCQKDPTAAACSQQRP